MLELLLFGLVLVAIYLISHSAVMKIEAWSGRSLGMTRTVLFFALFLGMTLLSMWALR